MEIDDARRRGAHDASPRAGSMRASARRRKPPGRGRRRETPWWNGACVEVQTAPSVSERRFVRSVRCGDGGLTENGTRGQTRGSSDARGVAGTGAGVSARTVSLPCAALGASACVVRCVSGRRIGDFSPSIGHREHSPRFLSQKFLGLSTSFTRSLRDFFLWPREFAKWIRTNGSSNVVRGYKSLS